MNNYTFSLSYNLVSEVANSVERLYRQNSNFDHLIVDVGFPLTEDKIPDDIEKAKKENTKKLIELSHKYNCDYLRIENKGVSQNHNAVYDYLQPDIDDIVIAVDPDEVPVEPEWVNALCEVLREDTTLGYAAPLLIDAKPIVEGKIPVRVIGKHAVYDMQRMNLNYGLIAIAGHFLKKIGQVPVPPDMKVYGGIERMLLEKLKKHNMTWAILKYFTQAHTNNCKVYRAWKNIVIFQEAYKGKPQTSFEEWLKQKVEV